MVNEEADRPDRHESDAQGRRDAGGVGRSPRAGVFLLPFEGTVDVVSRRCRSDSHDGFVRYRRRDVTRGSPRGMDRPELAPRRRWHVLAEEYPALDVELESILEEGDRVRSIRPGGGPVREF